MEKCYELLFIAVLFVYLCFSELINRNVRSNDPRILALIRRSLVAPSSGPLKPSHGIHMTRQSSVVDNVLGAKVNCSYYYASHTVIASGGRVHAWRHLEYKYLSSYRSRLHRPRPSLKA